MKSYDRKTPRAQRYDYRSSGTYFITICTKDRVHYFGDVVNGEMVLNELGKICDQEIQDLSHRQTVNVHEWVVMPNHVHMVIDVGEFTEKMNIGYGCRDALVGRPNKGNIGRPNDNHSICNRTGHEPVPTIIHHEKYIGPSLGQNINVLKGNVTKYANQQHIPFARQGRFHDHIIRDQQSYERIVYYIRNNPKKRKKDTSRYNGAQISLRSELLYKG